MRQHLWQSSVHPSHRGGGPGGGFDGNAEKKDAGGVPRRDNEFEENDDISRYEEFLRWRDTLRRRRLFFGKNRKLVGYLMQYSWLMGIPVAVIFMLFEGFTYHEPPKEVTERYNRLYRPRSDDSSSSVSQEEKSSSGIFEESDAYDESEVFDFNPTEVAPSLK